MPETVAEFGEIFDYHNPRRWILHQPNGQSIKYFAGCSEKTS
tara:strand:+ start:10724 stop:10849 length:126 start_codon:yes stop_codon:yes gene_type:complete